LAHVRLDWGAAGYTEDFNSIGATNAGKPPKDTRFCFPNTGIAHPFQGFENGGLSLCLGAF
jgi:hypothetical protein